MANQIGIFYRFSNFLGIAYVCFDEASAFRDWLVRRRPKTIYDSHIFPERLQFPYEMAADKSQSSGNCNIPVFLKHVTIFLFP